MKNNAFPEVLDGFGAETSTTPVPMSPASAFGPNPFTMENGLLTQTLKQKREKIIQRDLKLINEIYGL